MLAEVMADVSAGIADAIRIKAGFRKQHQARGFQSGRRQDNYFRFGLIVFSRITIEEGNAGCFSGICYPRSLHRPWNSGAE